MTDNTPRDLESLSSAERIEADVSALLDGELERERLLEVIDRLVDEPAARAFYRRSRVLGALIEASEPLPRAEAPPEIWERIAQECEQPTDSLIPLSRKKRPRRSAHRLLAPLAAAAAVVLALALAVWVREESPLATQGPVIAEPQIANITVGARTGQMTEDRFVALATELLEADERYRREMLEIISTVELSSPNEIGTVEASRFGEGRETTILTSELDTIEDGRVDRNLNVRMW